MAKCEKVQVKEYNIVLTLTPEEAGRVKSLVGRVVGNKTTSIYAALNLAGVKSEGEYRVDESYNSIKEVS